MKLICNKCGALILKDINNKYKCILCKTEYKCTVLIKSIKEKKDEQ